MDLIKAVEQYGYLYTNNNTAVSGVESDDFDSVFNNAIAVGETNPENLIETTVNEVADSYDLDEIFERVAAEYGLDVDFLRAVAQAESGFDPNAVSSSGAMGIMQLMPETAKSLEVDDPFDPEQNIIGGAKMLAYLLDDHNGNRTLALAGYNAGPNAVLRCGGVPPYSQTINYINKINNILGGALDGESWTIDGSEWSAQGETIKPYVSSYSTDKSQGIISAGDGTLGMSSGIAGVGYSNNSIYKNVKFSNNSTYNEIDYQEGDVYNAYNVVNEIINNMSDIMFGSDDEEDALVSGNDIDYLLKKHNLINTGADIIKTSPQSLYEAQAVAVSPLISQIKEL